MGMTVGDFDGDGQLDLAVTNEDRDQVSLFRNGDDPGISFDPEVALATAVGAYGVAASDLDGDGRLDLAVTNGRLNKIWVYRNLGVPGTISFERMPEYALAKDMGAGVRI